MSPRWPSSINRISSIWLSEKYERNIFYIVTYFWLLTWTIYKHLVILNSFYKKISVICFKISLNLQQKTQKLGNTAKFCTEKKGCRHVVGSSFCGGEFLQLRECFSENEKEMRRLWILDICFTLFRKIIEFTTKKCKNLATLQNFALKKGCRHVVGSFVFWEKFFATQRMFSRRWKRNETSVNFRYLF